MNIFSSYFFYYIVFFVTIFSSCPSLASSFYKLDAVFPSQNKMWPYFNGICSPISDKAGNLYFYETNPSSRIHKLTQSGYFVNSLKVDFDETTQLGVDSKNNIYQVKSNVASDYSSVYLTKIAANGNIIEKTVIATNGAITKGSLYVDSNDNIHIAQMFEHTEKSWRTKIIRYNSNLEKIGETILNGTNQFGYEFSLYYDNDQYFIFSKGIYSYDVSGDLIFDNKSFESYNLMANMPLTFAIDKKRKRLILSNIINEPNLLNMNFDIRLIALDYAGNLISEINHKLKFKSFTPENKCAYSQSAWVSDKDEVILPFPNFNAIFFADAENYEIKREWSISDFSIPAYIESNDSNLYILKPNVRLLEIYDKKSFSLIRSISFDLPPSNMAIDSVGNVYVLFLEDKSIKIFDKDGSAYLNNIDLRQSLSNAGYNDAEIKPSLAVHGDSLYVGIHNGHHSIIRVTMDGKIINGANLIKGVINGSYVSLNFDANGNIYGTKDYTRTLYALGVHKYSSSLDALDTYFDPMSFANQDNPWVGGVYTDILFDKNGYFIAETPDETLGGDDRILVFGKDNQLKQEIGSTGFLATQFNKPTSITGDDNYLYIADAGNHRIVVYRKVDRPDRSKAIIIAGGDASGNPLWDAMQANANHAFWTLANQGYTKDNIQYLNRNTDLDLDGNGKPDDVDGLPTRVNVKAALTEWAKDADDVVLYLVGHGGNGTFQLGGGEILTATELRAWLDELQAVMPGKVTVIYDACESGSFQKPLSGSPYPRTVITSTSAKTLESAYFQDAISFSHLFWNEVFSGKTVSEAFQTTQTSITQAFGSQSPQMDSDGDGITNTANDYNVVAQQAIGNGTVYSGTAPTIGSVGLTPVGKGESTSTITAYNISDDKSVQSAWAIVRPPYANLGQDGKPVQNLPHVGLAKQDDGSYRGQFDGFEQPGTYQVIVYAQDQEGNTSQPVVETLNVISALERKAVILAGVGGGGQFTQDIKTQTDHAYNTLVSQGYSESSIEYLSASSVATAGVDRAASKEGLEFVMTEWAASSASDLLVYLVGDFTDGKYQVSATESISLAELNQWLDTAHSNIGGVVVVIHEGNGSGHLVTGLQSLSNKKRILISSSGINQASQVLGDGEVSFSRFFWHGIGQGSVVADAFSRAQAAMRQYQYAQINSNGNPQANEKDDLYQAKWHKLGLGRLVAANEPKIGTISPPTSISSHTSTLWVESIISLSPLKKVWAVITPPGYNPALNNASQRIEVDLHDQGNGRWQATYGGFERAGEYQVSIYALDNSNLLSAPRTTYITQTLGPDGYEIDNTWEQARPIAVNNAEAQWRNFHQADDVDYIRFDANPMDGKYTLEVKAEGQVDTVLALYDSRGQAVTGVDSQGRLEIDDTGAGDTELVYWQPLHAGTYYLKVRPFDGNSTSISAGYTVRIFPTIAPQKASLRGRISNANGQPVAGAAIWVGQNDRTTTDSNGHYSLALNAGDYDVQVEASGYEPVMVSLKARPEDALTQDMELIQVLDAPSNPPVQESTSGSIGNADGNRIQDMYIAYYGRPADPTGLEYWVKDLRVHNNLHTVLSSFGRSSEYTDRFGHYSDTELVNAIYQRLFNRDAEPEGLDYWVGTLRNGSSSLVEIALKIVDGAQNADRQIIVNKREVANAYTQHTRNGSLPLGLESVDAARALLDGVDETVASLDVALGGMKR